MLRGVLREQFRHWVRATWKSWGPCLTRGRDLSGSRFPGLRDGPPSHLIHAVVYFTVGILNRILCGFSANFMSLPTRF